MSTILPLWPHSKRTSKKLRRNLLVLSTICIGLFLWKAGYFENSTASHSRRSLTGSLPCRELPGANDTLVIVKTGATELQDRLPVHLHTTFRCYPHYIVVSDHEETYRGLQIRDALDSVSEEKKAEHADFGLYRRLKQSGRKALEESELSGSESEETNWGGKRGNQGWKVDKWKFVPMVNNTYYDFPDFKWYLFIEADTYIMWATLLQYLNALDHTKNYYIGNQMVIGDDVFAHGGSGFVVSQSAMRVMTDYYATYKMELEAFTDWHWAGDCVLGMAFKKAKIPLTYAWPIFIEEYPGKVPYGKLKGASIPDPSKRLWCYPTVSYHHVNPEMVESLFEFEQDWMDTRPKSSEPFLRHKDIFQKYIMPRMKEIATDWDNENDADEGLGLSMEECEARCQASSVCLQWSLEANGGLCKTRQDPGLGKAKQNVTSGWMYDRIVKFADQPPCKNEGWILK